MRIQYTIEEQSRIGGRSENQDSCHYQETKYGLLAVVCDGMGGIKGGKTASMTAVSTIYRSIAHSAQSCGAAALVEAIENANLAVHQAGLSNPQLHGMGTTVAALLIGEEKAITAHVGDSRIYQVRGGKKVFRTFDHSRVFQLVKRGIITEEQARLSAESNIILKALGPADMVDVEINDNIPFLKGDRFLLCSDGICGSVDEQQMCQLIEHSSSVTETADNMASVIDNIGIEKGGRHDNLTAILVEVNTKSKTDVKMNKQAKIIILILSILLLIFLGASIFLAFKCGLFG